MTLKAENVDAEELWRQLESVQSKMDAALEDNERLRAQLAEVRPQGHAIYLWKITQRINRNWDRFESAIVAASTQIAAQHIHPDTVPELRAIRWSGSQWVVLEKNGDLSAIGNDRWAPPDHVDAERIGIADAAIAEGTVLLADYLGG